MLHTYFSISFEKKSVLDWDFDSKFKFLVNFSLVSLMKVVFLSIVKRAIFFTKKDYKNISTHFTTLCDIFDPSIAY